MKTRIALALALAALATTPAAAQLTPTMLVNETFDTYTTQAEFEAVWPAYSPQPSATLSTTQAKSAPNAIHIRGVTTAEGNTVAPRNQLIFEETGNPSADPGFENIIRYTFDFFDSNAAAAPYRQYANLQDSLGTGGGQLIAMGLNNNQSASANGGNYYMARLVGYNPQNDGDTITDTQPIGAFFKLNGTNAEDPASVPLRSTGWHNLAVDISPTEFKFYVDGIHARTVTNTLTLRSYETIRLGAGLSNLNNEAYYDNFQVILNPPPIEPPPAKDADFDDDGDVDGADFLTWQRGIDVPAGTATRAQGDADGNGSIDAADLGIWTDQFGDTGLTAAGAAIGAVPEPAAGLLAALAIVSGLVARRRK